MSNKYQEVKDDVTSRIISACGRTGVLNAVDNDKLHGDVKTRHQAAKDDIKKKFGEDGAKNPHIQAIWARRYGLI